MNTYRNVAPALAACAVSLSLAACSAGITSASTATSSSPAASHSTAAAAASSSSPAATGRMISVTGGSIGSFPVPTGAKVAEDISTSSTISIMFGKVTPAKVQNFYAQALPRAGYTVTGNSSASQSGGMVLIQFAGHGYQGEVTTMAKASAQETLPGLGRKDITAIILQPK